MRTPSHFFPISLLLLAACGSPKGTPELTKDSAMAGQDYPLEMKKALDGIDFFATGNEPFWSLDLDFDEVFAFKTPDGITLNTPPTQGSRAADASVMRYAAETEAGSISITIQELECIDNMSGEKSTHQVRVEVKDPADTEYTTFAGCGRYVPNYTLNDIWALVSLNGEQIDPTKLTKGVPTLEVHITDRMAMGNAGCNSYRGPVTFPDRHMIQFGPLASTMMACPDRKLEDAFTKAITNKRMTYTLGDLRLTLTHPDGTEVVFKKVD